MDLLDGFKYDVQRTARPAILVALGSLTVLMVVGLVAVVIYGFTVARPTPPNALDADIPLPAYGSGVVQVFDCIHRGEAQCPEYQEAKDWLMSATIDSGLEYSPSSIADGPGEQTDSGTILVHLTPQTTEEEWAALAAVITHDGAINPSNVNEGNIVQQDDMITFVANTDSGTVQGAIQFNIEAERISLISIIYGAG